MDTNDSVLISVSIDSRTMRLRVSKKDEEHVLLAAQTLNKRIDAFRRYNSNEPIDRLSWAALDLAGDCIRLQRDASRGVVPTVASNEALPDELHEIEALLSQF